MIKLRTLVAISLIAIAGLIGALQVYHASREGPKVSPNGKMLDSNVSIIETASRKLKSSASQEESYLTLLQLETDLKDLPPEEAEEAIISYLDTGDNARTELQFLLDANGFLETAPTLRVFLLDQLGIIDPESAAAYSKRILAKEDSPDEWAIALRNYARDIQGSPEEDPYLKEKLEALLTHKTWSDAPTLGYLQAYDLIVFYGGNIFVPELSKQIEDDSNPATQYAARLTLDRLAIHDYTTTAQAMLKSMDALKNSPKTRARIFARADVSDTSQRTLVKAYLLDQDLSNEELNAFAQSFPNINLEISYNLITQEEREPLASYTERDRASLTMVQDILEHQSLSASQETAFNTLKERLTAIDNSIERGSKQASQKEPSTTTHREP